MSENKPEADEFALGALALVFSVGFLKANELFDYFDRLDVFVVQEHVLHIHFRELLALVCFALAYIVFLFVAGWGTYRIYHRRTTSSTDLQERKGEKHASALDVLVVVMLALIAVHFFALCGAYSHVMHKYSEEIKTSSEVRWDIGS